MVYRTAIGAPGAQHTLAALVELSDCFKIQHHSTVILKPTATLRLHAPTTILL